MNNRKDLIDKIEKFRELKPNWNGYNTQPLSEKLINRALDFVRQVNPVPTVFPTQSNSIQLRWENDPLYLEIEIFEDHIEIFNQTSNRGELTTIGSDC